MRLFVLCRIKNAIASENAWKCEQLMAAPNGKHLSTKKYVLPSRGFTAIMTRYGQCNFLIPKFLNAADMSDFAIEHETPSSKHLLTASSNSQYFTLHSSLGVLMLRDVVPPLGYDRWNISLVFFPLSLGTKPIGLWI